MTSFLGKYYYTLDPKGRVIIPAPLREIIFQKYNNTKLYITNAPVDKCLQIYPLDEWNRLEEKVRTLPKTDEAVKYFMRRVIASAVDCDLDKQGRILVPSAHREDSEIKNDIVIVGQIDKIEIWDKQQWEIVTDPSKIDVKSVESALAGYGL
ncbi:MAG: division/cell wall cluster transcriptional repressor MraZ [Nitrospiraceae bacterium]|nr:division/cell wall cluster transcriptional repressor MraZ [Nitrospiraceae bacterium]